MFLIRTGALSRNRFNLSQRFTSLTIKRNTSSKVDSTSKDKPLNLQEENDLDKPIKYSKTEAASTLARQIRCPDSDAHPYQGYIISGSLTVFMIYFFILREENDIDLLMYKPLNEAIPDTDGRSVQQSSQRSK